MYVCMYVRHRKQKTDICSCYGRVVVAPLWPHSGQFIWVLGPKSSFSHPGDQKKKRVRRPGQVVVHVALRSCLCDFIVYGVVAPTSDGWPCSSATSSKRLQRQDRARRIGQKSGGGQRGVYVDEGWSSGCVQANNWWVQRGRRVAAHPRPPNPPTATTHGHHRWPTRCTHGQPPQHRAPRDPTMRRQRQRRTRGRAPCLNQDTQKKWWYQRWHTRRSAQHGGSGCCKMAAWCANMTPGHGTSGATLFFHYRVGCWCEATRRHALLPHVLPLACALLLGSVCSKVIW